MKKALQSLMAFVAVWGVSAVAMAQEGAAAPHAGGGMMAVAIAIGIGIAALGGALGQSRAAAAALEGISRNPNASDKVFVPMILGLAFIESLVLFTWVLMFLLLNKI
ncbi:MAG TPA: ATP synthase F0 subunit C [Myxococcota bacterium]|nr:ATP synthase F0 subunit C [Myxococcota bacterium]